MSTTGPDVTAPVPLSDVESSWGKAVTDDLAELWATKADRTDIPSVPPWVPIVVKSTPPTAADYGTTDIPLNAVWIVAP